MKGLLSFKSTSRRSLWFQNRAISRLSNELTLESRPLSRLSTHNTSSETNVLVAWLERFEDHAQFPVDELLMVFGFSQIVGHSVREKDTVVIFIHHLRSGLYRIHIRSTIRYIRLIPFLLLPCKFFLRKDGIENYRNIIHKAYIIEACLLTLCVFDSPP